MSGNNDFRHLNMKMPLTQIRGLVDRTLDEDSETPRNCAHQPVIRLASNMARCVNVVQPQGLLKNLHSEPEEQYLIAPTGNGVLTS